MAFLEIESGTRRSRLELSGEALLIGRSRSCALVLEDPQVSREHARLVRAGEGWRVEDLGSRHGTLVNGRRVEGLAPLEEGDAIAICASVLRFRDPAPPAEAAADPARDPSTLIVSTRDASDDAETMRAPAEARLRALLDITHSLQSALLVGDILPRVLESVFRILPQAQWGLILLQDAATGELIPAASSGKRGGEGAPRYSRTIVERALSRKEAILSADARTDGEFQSSLSVSTYGIRSFLCVPFLDKEKRPMGILQVHSEETGRPFAEEDLELAVSVAGAVGMALENARLHQELLARERVLREAELARDVQRRFLPSSPPQVEGYRFFDHYLAAGQVGGDYFGYIPLPGHRLAIALGDVSGKGMPAAMLMARLSSDVRFSAICSPDPAAALDSVNRSLSEAEMEDRFVTLVLLVLDQAAHTITLACAGHPPPLLRRADGSIEELGEGTAGWPLMVDLERRYRSSTCELEPGSTVLLYSDGLSEAQDRAGSFLGEERLRALLAAAPADPLEAGRAVVEGVRAFSGDAPQHDDLTLVCFGRISP